MNNIIINKYNKYSFKGGFDKFGNHKENQDSYSDLPFIRQQLHDTKIDKFFHTDLEAPSERTSFLAAAGAIAGVAIPTLFFAKKQKPKLKINSFKNLLEAINIEYGLPQILGTGLGGVLGGLAGGLIDRKERNKINKLEEASYQIMNISFPALLVGGGLELCKKYKSLNNPFVKILIPIVSILVGVNLAVKGSNKIDDILFDKHLPDGNRKFRKKDLIVHVDDLFGTLVLAKVPFADKLHINKILPAIFAWSGYHVGES